MNEGTYPADHTIKPFEDFSSSRNLLAPHTPTSKDETLHIPVSAADRRIDSPGEVVSAATEEKPKDGAKQDAEEQVHDHREPKVNPFMMLPVISYEIIPILLAALAAAAQGVIPLVFYWVLGNLIGSIETT
jgi:hypothetical protein